jgi:glycosyltransferase involved in cell wall biosynthesis
LTDETPAAPLRLFLTADAVGGVWTYALDLARALAPEGVETTLAVLGPDPDEAQVADAAAIPRLRLLLTDLPLDWTAADADEVVDAAHELASLAEEAGADIVHLHSGALADAAFPAPVVVSCHSCVATWWAAVRSGPLPDDFLWRAKLVGKGYRAADALIAPTAAFAKLTARTYGLPQAPAVVHNGRRVLPQRQDRPAFASSFAFTAGRLWDDGKNIAALDRAAARTPILILAAGPVEGPNGARIVLENVKALGPLSEDEVARWLKPAPVFVSAARYEPFGLAVLEAAQAGCALVLSDIPTFRELWQGAALFVPPDDDHTIAAAIDGLVKEQALRADLGATARERALRYSVEAMAAGVLATYRSLVQRGRSGAPAREAVA